MSSGKSTEDAPPSYDEYNGATSSSSAVSPPPQQAYNPAHNPVQQPYNPAHNPVQPLYIPNHVPTSNVVLLPPPNLAIGHPPANANIAHLYQPGYGTHQPINTGLSNPYRGVELYDGDNDERFTFKNSLLNVLFMFFGGGLAFFLVNCVFMLLMMILVVGFPVVPGLFRNAVACILPYGSDLSLPKGKQGCRSITINVIWSVFFGFALCTLHFFFGVALVLSIFMIPFGLIHFKLARRALFPITAIKTNHKQINGQYYYQEAPSQV